MKKNKISNGMNYLKKNIFATFLMAFIILLPLISFAQGTIIPTPSTKIVNPIEAKDITAFIKTILEGVIKIGIPIVALAIIYSGFLFVQAMGKPEKMTKAKDALLYTIIGAAILLGSWAIAQLISDTVLAL